MGKVEYRKYPNYRVYLEHQKNKHRKNEEYFKQAFQRRYKDIHARIIRMVKHVPTRGKALCLGARRGEEVKSLRMLGFDAIGIDLYPGHNNKYVVRGDFHNLKFKDRSVGLIYTNCLDHSFDLGKIVSECERVLVVGGFILLEVSKNAKLTTKYRDKSGKRHIDRGTYESMIWESTEDVAKQFKEAGFVEVCRLEDDPKFAEVILTSS